MFIGVLCIPGSLKIIVIFHNDSPVGDWRDSIAGDTARFTTLADKLGGEGDCFGSGCCIARIRNEP